MYRAGMVPLFAFAVLVLHPPVTGRPPQPQAAPAIQAPAPAPALTVPSVRVQHELVRLPKPAPRANRPPAWRSTRMALANPPYGRAALLVRASRALVGDGRYKPEPFPRLSR
jgi:hypothetical protein